MLIGEPLSDRVYGGSHLWIGGGQEPHNRHHQRGGIQGIGAKCLGECSSFLAPTILEDGVADLLTCRCAGSNPVMRMQYIGNVDSAVKCYPTHELSVKEIPWVSTHLPDTLVALPPTCCCGISNLNQDVARNPLHPTAPLPNALRPLHTLPLH